MYDTAKRVELVKARADAIRRRQAKRGIRRLSALCAVLTVSCVGVFSMATDPELPAMWGMSGTMLLHENAGGYVLVGVIAFAAAVVITVLCIRYRERSKQDDQTRTDEEHEK